LGACRTPTSMGRQGTMTEFQASLLPAWPLTSATNLTHRHQVQSTSRSRRVIALRPPVKASSMGLCQRSRGRMIPHTVLWMTRCGSETWEYMGIHCTSRTRSESACECVNTGIMAESGRQQRNVQPISSSSPSSSNASSSSYCAPVVASLATSCSSSHSSSSISSSIISSSSSSSSG